MTERGSSFEGFREDDMGVGDERDRSKKRDRNSRRRNRTTVQAARRAVLQQNQTVCINLAKFCEFSMKCEPNLMTQEERRGGAA